jgi:hypothetical protein
MAYETIYHNDHWVSLELPVDILIWIDPCQGAYARGPRCFRGQITLLDKVIVG